MSRSAPDPTNAADRGVEVYARRATGWVRAGHISEPQYNYLDDFGSAVALSGDGSRLVIGAPDRVHPAPSTWGGAFVYQDGPHGWVEQEELVPGPADSFFGDTVAMSADGSTVAVSSSWATVDGVYAAGRVIAFTPDQTGHWVATHYFVAKDPTTPEGHFGSQIAVSATGDTVVVGQRNPGTVTVFDRRGRRWARTATFTGHGTARYGGFGAALAVSADGRTVIAGAPWRSGDRGATPYTGGAYRFTHDLAGWHLAGLLYVDGSRAYENVASAIAVSADATTVVLGAPGYARIPLNLYTNTGAVYVLTT